MAKERYNLSGDDVKFLRGIIGQFKKLRINPDQLPFVPNPTLTAPNVYIALTPSSGIPAMRSGNGVGTGSFSVDVPGNALCKIYRLQFIDGVQGLYLVNTSVTVYNITFTAVPANTYIIIKRDKFGVWIADVPASNYLPPAYRDDCIGGHIYRFLWNMTTQTWNFDSLQGCCECGGTGSSPGCCPNESSTPTLYLHNNSNLWPVIQLVYDGGSACPDGHSYGSWNGTSNCVLIEGYYVFCQVSLCCTRYNECSDTPYYRLGINFGIVNSSGKLICLGSSDLTTPICPLGAPVPSVIVDLVSCTPFVANLTTSPALPGFVGMVNYCPESYQCDSLIYSLLQSTVFANVSSWTINQNTTGYTPLPDGGCPPNDNNCPGETGTGTTSSWNCVEGECVQVMGSGGKYKTLALCKASCTSTGTGTSGGQCCMVSPTQLTGVISNWSATGSNCGTCSSVVDGLEIDFEGGDNLWTASDFEEQCIGPDGAFFNIVVECNNGVWSIGLPSTYGGVVNSFLFLSANCNDNEVSAVVNISFIVSFCTITFTLTLTSP